MNKAVADLITEVLIDEANEGMRKLNCTPIHNRPRDTRDIVKEALTPVRKALHGKLHGVPQEELGQALTKLILELTKN